MGLPPKVEDEQSGQNDGMETDGEADEEEGVTVGLHK